MQTLQSSGSPFSIVLNSSHNSQCGMQAVQPLLFPKSLQVPWPARRASYMQCDLVALLSQPGPVCAPDMVSVMEELHATVLSCDDKVAFMIMKNGAAVVAAVVFAALVGATSAVDNGIGEREHRCFH
jgi:hypothetical protein